MANIFNKANFFAPPEPQAQNNQTNIGNTNPYGDL
jgi:hypothetical protein